MGIWFDKTLSETTNNESSTYRYLVEVDVRDVQGEIVKCESLKIKLTYALKSSHTIMRNLGISQAIIPGLDPKKTHMKPWQDNCFITEHRNTFLFGLYDGHGDYGKEVATFCSAYMQDEFTK